MDIGTVIGKLIKKKGLTQAEFAKRIDKSPTALSQIIKGVYKPNPATLEKICQELEIPEPILHFLTISEEDVPKEKLELYRMLAPALRDFIVKIFGEDVELLEEEVKDK